MSRMRDITVLIYEEEATKLSRWTLQYPNIETGGDLFGLWQSETEVVIQLVIGPGAKCRRTATSFFQDERYLGDVGTYLTSTEGLCNIGEWHSHHSLNLPEPSSGDRQTVWRHMPRYGLKRFLLLIATIKSGLANTHSFMFTSPENASRSGEMFLTKYQILPGPNPFRAQSEVQERLNIGAEMWYGSPSSREFKDNRKQIKKENREREKMEKKNRKWDKKEKEKNKKEKKKNKKEMRKEKEDERAENETPKKCKEKRKDGGGKIKRLWPGHSKNIDGKKYSGLFDKNGMALTANDQDQPRTESRKVDNWQITLDGGRSESEQDREQTESRKVDNWQITPDGGRSASEQHREQTRSPMASSGNITPSITQYSQVTHL